RKCLSRPAPGHAAPGVFRARRLRPRAPGRTAGGCAQRPAGRNLAGSFAWRGSPPESPPSLNRQNRISSLVPLNAFVGVAKTNLLSIRFVGWLLCPESTAGIGTHGELSGVRL